MTDPTPYPFTFVDLGWLIVGVLILAVVGFVGWGIVFLTAMSCLGG